MLTAAPRGFPALRDFRVGDGRALASHLWYLEPSRAGLFPPNTLIPVTDNENCVLQEARQTHPCMLFFLADQLPACAKSTPSYWSGPHNNAP